jgi:hypothetical protein
VLSPRIAHPLDARTGQYREEQHSSNLAPTKLGKHKWATDLRVNAAATFSPSADSEWYHYQNDLNWALGSAHMWLHSVNHHFLLCAFTWQSSKQSLTSSNLHKHKHM